MRVLYLGANLRMRQFMPGSQTIRALGLKLGLEQSGVQVIPLMAGDQINIEEVRTVYSKGLKRFLPQKITGALRDIYEIYFDWKLSQITEPQILKIKPDIILQKHSRYGQIGVRMSCKYHIPVFLDDITPVWEGEKFNDRSLKLTARYIRKKVFSQATGLIAVSPAMEAQLRSENIHNDRIILVPNGVDCDLFDPDVAMEEVRQKYGLSNKIVVGYVGIFADYHRIDLLIRAACCVAQSIPSIHFLLVGNYRDEKLKDMARAYEMENRITFTGPVPHAQVPAYINAMDFCVVPAALSYMSPMKIYEYMAMRKPVIAPTRNSISEAMVFPNKNGLLFEAGDENSLADAITTLASNLEMVKELGAEARRFVQNNFTWYHQTQNLLKAFEVARKLLQPSISTFGGYALL